jgi:hypothetical protein
MIGYRIWQFISIIISGIIAWVINPLTFGISPTKNIPLNILIKGTVFVIIYLIKMD